jgi:hypothetical protein
MRTTTTGKRPMPPSKEHCLGVGDGARCKEAATCVLHVRQMTEPVDNPMRLPRVDGRACHYRVEVAA